MLKWKVTKMCALAMTLLLMMPCMGIGVLAEETVEAPPAVKETTANDKEETPIAETPGVSQTPAAPETPVAPETPAVVGTSDVVEVPDVVDVSDEAETPESVEAPDVAETPNAVDESDADVEAPIYTIRYVNANGNELLVVELEEGQPIERPQFLIPTFENHLFTHWYDADSGTDAFRFGVGASRDMTLKAFFAETENDTDLEPNENQADLEAGPEVGVSNRSVGVYIDAGTNLKFGDTVTLCGVLTGYADIETMCQWQVKVNGEWKEIAGANKINYTFVLDRENAYQTYRLEVIVDA